MYREVTMIEITEVLRLWRDGVPKKRIAARLGLDPKTVRRYITTAETTGLPCDSPSCCANSSKLSVPSTLI